MEFKQLITSNQDFEPSGTGNRRSYNTRSHQASYIKQWKESHLTQQAFCEKHDLNIKTFHSWLKKSKDLNRSVHTNDNSVIHAHVNSNSQNNCSVELQLPKGVRIILKGYDEQDGLITLIKGLMSCKFR